MHERKNIGEHIQALRKAGSNTLQELSEKSGISEDTLSKIESGKYTPPLGNIISLAKALGLSVGEVLGDESKFPFCIVRSQKGEAVSRFNSETGGSCGYSYTSLGHQKKNRQMEPFLVTLTPQKDTDVLSNEHIGEEIIYVLDGEVEVRLQDHSDILKPGDSIYYDSNLPHSITCHGDDPATILAVIYAKEEMIIL